MGVKVECDGCGNETTAITCARCVEVAAEQATDNVIVDCAHCNHAAEVCGNCARSAPSETVREYATRRKALGLLSIDGYNAIMLMVEDLEAIHG